MKEEIKNLRIEIDGLAQLTKELNPVKIYVINEKPTKEEVLLGKSLIKIVDGNSKEIEKAVDSLYLAKAWLGKVLGELGNENPYGSGYKTKEDIVSTQDVKENVETTMYDLNPFNGEGFWKDKNHIEKVDWLRGAIEQVLIKIRFIGDLPLSGTAYSNTLINNVTTHLSEARFWLGFELERIKQSN